MITRKWEVNIARITMDKRKLLFEATLLVLKSAAKLNYITQDDLKEMHQKNEGIFISRDGDLMVIHEDELFASNPDFYFPLASVYTPDDSEIYQGQVYIEKESDNFDYLTQALLKTADAILNYGDKEEDAQKHKRTFINVGAIATGNTGNNKILQDAFNDSSYGKYFTERVL